METLNDCWIILKNQLLKENIDSIEKFMSYIFSDLFPILNEEKRIDKYDSLKHMQIQNMKMINFLFMNIFIIQII